MKQVIYLLCISLLCCSCTSVLVLSRENISGGRTLELNMIQSGKKGEKKKQLNGIIRNSDGKWQTLYSVTARCGCVGKSVFLPGESHYRLSTGPDFQIPINEDDKLVFRKFLELTAIEKFCSKSLLDSAKGFISK